MYKRQTWFGLRTAIWAGAIGLSLAWVPLVFGPLLSLKEMPEQVEEPGLRAETEGEALISGPFPQPEET